MEAVLGTATRSCFESFVKDNGETYLRCFPHCSCVEDTITCGNTFDVLWCIPDFNPDTLKFYGEFVQSTDNCSIPKNNNETIEATVLSLGKQYDYTSLESRLHDRSLYKGFIRRWLPLNDTKHTVRVKVVFDEKGEWVFNPSRGSISISSRETNGDQIGERERVTNNESNNEHSNNAYKFHVFAVQSVEPDVHDNNGDSISTDKSRSAAVSATIACDNDDAVMTTGSTDLNTTSTAINSTATRSEISVMRDDDMIPTNESETTAAAVLTDTNTTAVGTTMADCFVNSDDNNRNSAGISSNIPTNHCYVVMGDYFSDSFTIQPSITSSPLSSFCRRNMSKSNSNNPLNADSNNNSNYDSNHTRSLITEVLNFTTVYSSTTVIGGSTEILDILATMISTTDKLINNNNGDHLTINSHNVNINTTTPQDIINSISTSISHHLNNDQEINFLQLPARTYAPNTTHLEQEYMVYQQLKKRSYVETILDSDNVASINETAFENDWHTNIHNNQVIVHYDKEKEDDGNDIADNIQKYARMEE